MPNFLKPTPEISTLSAKEAKFTKKKKRAERKEKARSKKFKVHWRGFLLGFLLSWIGVLISLAFKDQDNALYSALIGFGAALLISAMVFLFYVLLV
ncbi:MAG: hypothetical protein HC880_12250 [Bacteroidia bacterium]|nr:hypothetical protein [Bacteroidia bacterium]